MILFLESDLKTERQEEKFKDEKGKARAIRTSEVNKAFFFIKDQEKDLLRDICAFYYAR